MGFINPVISDETIQRIAAEAEAKRTLSDRWHESATSNNFKEQVSLSYVEGRRNPEIARPSAENPYMSLTELIRKASWFTGTQDLPAAQTHFKRLGALTTLWEEYLGPELDPAKKAVEKDENGKVTRRSSFAPDFVAEMNDLVLIREWVRAVLPVRAMPERAEELPPAPAQAMPVLRPAANQ